MPRPSGAARLALTLVALAVVVIGLLNFALWLTRPPGPLPFFVTHPLTVLAAIYLVTQYVSPRLMSRQSREESARREQLLRASGAPLATTRAGARVGKLHFRRGQLKIEVYPAGILLSAAFTPTSAILTSEITALRLKRSLLEGEQLEVVCSPGSTITSADLYIAPTGEVAKAIEQLTGLQPAPAASH